MVSAVSFVPAQSTIRQRLSMLQTMVDQMPLRIRTAGRPFIVTDSTSAFSVSTVQRASGPLSQKRSSGLRGFDKRRNHQTRPSARSRRESMWDSSSRSSRTAPPAGCRRPRSRTTPARRRCARRTASAPHGRFPPWRPPRLDQDKIPKGYRRRPFRPWAACGRRRLLRLMRRLRRRRVGCSLCVRRLCAEGSSASDRSVSSVSDWYS